MGEQHQEVIRQVTTTSHSISEKETNVTESSFKSKDEKVKLTERETNSKKMANTAESFVICISLLYNQGVGGLDTPGRAHLHGGKSKRVGTTPCHGQLQFVRTVNQGEMIKEIHTKGKA